jgi:hypothetical protein
MANESTTPVARIRAADEALESAQNVLDKARSGLRAAEKAAMKVEKVERHPVRWVFGFLALAGVAALIAKMVHSDR